MRIIGTNQNDYQLRILWFLPLYQGLRSLFLDNAQFDMGMMAAFASTDIYFSLSAMSNKLFDRMLYKEADNLKVVGFSRNSVI